MYVSPVPSVLVQSLCKVWWRCRNSGFLVRRLSFFLLKSVGFLYLQFNIVTFTHITCMSSRNNERMTCGYSQFYDNGTWFDFIHFHKSETFSAGESFLGFVVLEFKENSCSCKRETWRVKSPSWFISLFLSGRSCQVRTGVRTFGKFFEMFLDFHVHTEMNVRVFFLRGHRRVLNWIQIYSVHIWRATQVWTFKNSFYRIKHDMTLRISTFNTEGDVRINALPCVLQTDLLYG